jgi:hypothetical protein
MAAATEFNFQEEVMTAYGSNKPWPPRWWLWIINPYVGALCLLVIVLAR